MIRKSCRWLSLSAALCVAASGLSGCGSKPLLSGLRFPGSKSASPEKSEKSVAAKGKPVKPSVSSAESAKLLAQAQEYEREGDFPNAARTYRQYFEQQGAITPATRSKPSPKPADDKTALASKTRPTPRTDEPSDAVIRPASKSKPVEKKPLPPIASDGPSDPWAEESKSLAAKPTKQKALPTDDGPKITPQNDRSDAVALKDRPAWADVDQPSIRPMTKAAVETDKPLVSREDLDDLLDLDEGELDWGEEAKDSVAKVEAEVATDLPATDEVVAAADSPATAGELPRLDLFDEHASVEEEVETPVDGNVAAIPETELDDAPQFESITEPALPEMTTASAELSPPVLDDTSPAIDTVSIAELCKHCEPWIYSWAIKLDSADPEVRKDALTQLANAGSEARPAAPAVRQMLSDRDALVQCHAAWAVWEIENDSQISVSVLTNLINSPHPDVAQLACYILGDIGESAESAVEGLVTLRDNADAETCIHAAEALIRIRGTDATSVQLLCDSLKSRSAQERWLAAVALGRCRGKHADTAVRALTKSLNDVDVDVRCAAALSLGGLGTDAKPAIGALEKVSLRDDPIVSDAANAALACIRP